MTYISHSQDAGSSSFGAALVDPESLQLFLRTGARTIWPGLPFEWRRINPSGDRCAWDYYDKLVKALPDSANLIGRFVTGSGWGRVRDNREAYAQRPFSPPRNLSEYRRFVLNTVRHYRGQVKYWQLLDEPFHPGVWLGSASQYGQLLKTTWSAVKEADPSSKVLPGSLPIEAVAPVLIRQLLDHDHANQAIELYHVVYQERSGTEPYPKVKSEADLRQVLGIPLAKHTLEFVSLLLDKYADYFDIFSFHDYGSYPSVEKLQTVIEAVCSMARERGMKQVMYLTGVSTDFNASDSDVAAAVAKRVAIAFSEGINFVLWWSFKDVPGEDRYNAHAGLLDSSGHPKSAYQTFSVIGQNLAKIRFRQAEPMSLSGVTAVRFSGDKGEFVILWSKSGAKEVSVPLTSAEARVISLVPQRRAKELADKTVATTDGHATITATDAPVLIATD